jgi:Tol biopolymer transport system component
VITPPAGFALESGVSRQSFALSPDGARLAFTAMDSSGAFRVFVQDLGSLEPRMLPNSEGVHTLFWAPDGRSLFLVVRGKLVRAPLEGEAHLFLCDAPSFMFAGVSFGPDKLLLSARATTYMVSSSGGTPEQTKDMFWWPQKLPGGHVLYTVWDSHIGRHRARVAQLDNPGSAKDLIESDSRALYTASEVSPGSGYLMYLRAGNLIASPFDVSSLRVVGEATPVASKVYSFFPTGAADFSVADRNVIAYQTYVARSQLAWVDREGRQAGTIGPARINVKSGRLSPDGRWLATAIYDVERGSQELWLVDSQTGAPRRLGIGPGVSDSPVWSPDSKKLAFLRAFDGKAVRIAIRGIGEKDTEVLLPAPTLGYRAPTDWSPDGRFVAFVTTGFPRFANETQGDVWLVDIDRDRKLIPLLDTPFHEANPAFSPDGKWLAFTSNESGRPEVYLQAFQSNDSPTVAGERYLVSRSGAQALRWRRDGKELFYLGFDGRVHAVPVKLSLHPEFGPAKPLFTISTEARAATHSILGFDVSPDGNRFVIPVVTSPESPSLVVVQNWEAQLPTR